MPALNVKLVWLKTDTSTMLKLVVLLLCTAAVPTDSKKGEFTFVLISFLGLNPSESEHLLKDEVG